MSSAFFPLGMNSYNNRTGQEGYVSWKGAGEYKNPTSSVGGNIRPLLNDATIYKHGLPRPIKHYRRGTICDPDRRSGNGVSISHAIDTPGGFVQAQHPNTECIGNTMVSGWAPIINATEKPQIGTIPCDINRNPIGGQVKKALNRVRPASTIVSKTYFQTSAEHLYNRCSTFDQAESHYHPNPLNCANKCANETVYKPNNAQFAQQGAVSSSTRLLKLQRTAIDKGSASHQPKQTPCIEYRRKR